MAELVQDCGLEVVTAAARRVEADWRSGKLTTAPVRRLASIARGMRRDGGFHGQAPPALGTRGASTDPAGPSYGQWIAATLAARARTAPGPES